MQLPTRARSPQTRLFLVVGVLALGWGWPAGVRAQSREVGLIGHWSFEHEPGALAVDSSPNALDGQLVGASIVKGAFGQAVECAGSDSYVLIPGPEGLDGSDELTVQAWVLWEGTAQYPNIVTGGKWSPGGFLLFVNQGHCSFRLGRPGHQAGRPGDHWQEVGANLLNPIPLKRWVHLAATFKRPLLTTYVNGKKVATAKWDYPVGFSGDILLGKWGNSVSHRGLIDEVKLYRGARSAEEIAADVAATRTGRDSAEYERLALPASPPVLTLRNSMALLQISAAGRVSQIRDLVNDRNLLTAVRPIARIRKAGRWLPAVRCRKEGDLLAVEFMRDAGTLYLRLTAEEAYFRIEIDRLEAADAREIAFLQFAVETARDQNRMAGLAADDRSGVCLRALNLATQVSLGGNPAAFRAATSAKYGLEKGKAALVAGPVERLREALKRVAEQEDVPKSSLGGPWSMDSPVNRGSYLFARVSEANVDDWIEMARRGGFSHIHFSGWATSLGHYVPRKDLFPNGLDGMKRCVAKIHAAGLRAGMHTLTGCIGTNDPWVTPVPDPRLVADASYTLAEDLSVDADEIRVLEPPGKHDVVWSYSGNGNVMRIGTELIRYHAIRRQEPYAFLELMRGAFRTKPRAHAKGDRVDHLQQRYLAFYPDEASTLVDEVAQRIAAVYNTCEMDQIYMDGSEGMRGWHPMAVMRYAIYNRLRRPALVEASAHGHHNWWFHSRLGAWDHAKWGVKRFHDDHCRSAENYRKTAFLEPQLGWWAFIGPSNLSRGQLPDEVEYFAAKNLALNAAMSLQGVSVGRRPANARQEEYFTLLGWYESLRLAGYFDDATRALLRPPGTEFRLRQDDAGVWRLIPANYAVHRITAVGNGSESWQPRNPFAEQRLRLRLEALYAVEPWDAGGGKTIAEFADLAPFTLRRTASGIGQTVATDTASTRGGGPALRIQAKNSRPDRSGSWARVGRRYSPYLSIQGNDALGVWVRGDGKGEVLNIQLRTPREHHACFAENYVTIDFTGWRYIELPLRERSADRYRDYKWPYRGGYSAIYRTGLDRKHISELNLYLNNLPPADTVDIAIGPIRALPIRKIELRTPQLTVNGGSLVLPVVLRSGEYVEIDEDGAVHFDERGMLLTRFVPGGSLPVLKAGPNAVILNVDSPPGLRARAEVTLITLGKPLQNPVGDRPIDWSRLDREYALPRTILRQDDIDNRWNITCRPGAAPELEFELAVEKAGAARAGYDGSEAILLDPCSDPAAFALSRANRYSQYAYDSTTKGVPAKPGVTHELLAETKNVKVGKTALRYTASSKRKDNGGWSAKGRRFDPPLDLSGCQGLGFWLYGDGKRESFKIQLRDVNGKWHDMVTRVDFSGWRYIEFEWLNAALDLGKIEYLIFYYNGIPAGETVTCLVDDVKALRETTVLRDPALTVGGATLTFPSELRSGQRLVLKAGGDCAIYSPAGKATTKVAVQGPLPRLEPGRNAVKLAFSDGSPKEFRVKAKLTKVYKR